MTDLYDTLGNAGYTGSLNDRLFKYLEGGPQGAMRYGVPNVTAYGASTDPEAGDTNVVAFRAMLDDLGYLRLPPGTFVLSDNLDYHNVIIEGAGAMHSIIRADYASTTKSLLKLGRTSTVRDVGLEFASSRITGSESTGERVLIECVGGPSSYPLQRGSSIERVRFGACGTGIYGPAGISGPFSTKFDTLDMYDFTFAGVHMLSATRTGNVYNNIYMSSDRGGVDCPFILAGEESECSIDQLNIEWVSANSAMDLDGVRGLVAGTIHIEQVSHKNSYSGFIRWNRSSGSIENLSFYYCPIVVNGGQLVRVLDSDYNGAVYDPDTCDYLRIGNLHLKGINDGSQVLSGNGLGGLTDFYVFDREPSAVGEFDLQVDQYTWNTFQSDQAVYQAFPSDPHSKINELPTPSGPPVAGISRRGTAAPTTGTWKRGDTIWNSAPSAAGVIGWVCTTAGSPGTWKSFGTIAA